MSIRGRKPGSWTVRIAPGAWAQVGRLSRAEFDEVQERLEHHSNELVRVDEELPLFGELLLDGMQVRYELDPHRKVVSLVGVLRR